MTNPVTRVFRARYNLADARTRLLGVQEVASSNLAGPTNFIDGQGLGSKVSQAPGLSRAVDRILIGASYTAPPGWALGVY